MTEFATTFAWDNANFFWNAAPENSTHPPYTWDDVQLIIRAAGDDYNQWEDNNKEKLVKLILKVHGNTITESRRKKIKQYKIKASDIKLTIEKVLGVEIMTEN